MRRRGDEVIIISGRYEGHRGTVEADVYQKTVDYPDEWAMLVSLDKLGRRSRQSD